MADDLISNLSTLRVSLLLQFIGTDDTNTISVMYADYKTGRINKRVCVTILIFSIPIWLLRIPLYFEKGDNPLFSLAWLFYILGFGIPIIVLLLKIPDDTNSEEPKIEQYKHTAVLDLVLLKRIQTIIALSTPLACGLLLLARTLSGECTFDNIQLINSNTCNPEHLSHAVPQDQVFIVGVLVLLICIFFKTPLYLTLCSHIESNVMIAVAVLYKRRYNSIWILIISSTLPLLVVYEYEREQMNIFLSLLKSPSIQNDMDSSVQNTIVNNDYSKSANKSTGKNKKSTKNNETMKANDGESSIVDMIQAVSEQRRTAGDEYSKAQSDISDLQNLETVTTNSLGSAAFSERRRQYINVNFGDYDNYSDFSEALESKSVESTIESVPEGHVAIIQEPSSPTADSAYRAAYMRSLAVGKIMDFVPCSMDQFNNHTNVDEIIDKSKIDRLLIAHRNLVVELENIKKESSEGELGAFWQRIDDFLQELDKYRTQNEVERQLLDYMTRSANNFRNRK